MLKAWLAGQDFKVLGETPFSQIFFPEKNCFHEREFFMTSQIGMKGCTVQYKTKKLTYAS